MLRIADVMELLKVSKPTVYKWIKQGLPIIKKGKLVFIEKEELDNFLKKGE